MSAVPKLITDHFDIWTAADTEKKSGRGRASGNANSVYGISKLRELILELAVRGKLVPQDPNDEPATELLKRLEAEKIKLVSEGKIKKDKPSTTISEIEKLFPIAKGWQWARWVQVALKIGDIDHKMPDTVPDGIPYVSPRDFYGNFIDFANAKTVSREDFVKLSAKIQPELGDLIFPRYGTIGENVLVDVDREFLVSYSCAVIKTMKGFIDPKFQFIFSISSSTKQQAKKAENKTTQANVGIKSIQEFIIPIPPLSEQKRIVAKVDELMVLCDQLEAQHNNAVDAHEQLVSHLLRTLTQSQDAEDFNANWQRIATHFDTLFTTESSIDALKQTLLQLAVMGKLVPQDPNDEPASELLKRIQVEKAKLVAEGKIKRDKLSTSISEIEELFPLAKGWQWAKWEQVALKIGDIDHKMPDTVSSGIPYVSPRDFYGNFIDFKNAKNISREDFIKLSAKIRPELGDLIFPRYGTIGENVLVDVDKEFLVSYSCAVIKTMKGFINPKYQFIYSISSSTKQQAKNAENKTTQANVGIKSIQEFIIPIPPLAEQQRIVAKVDELMALCDQMKSLIISKNQTQRNLADLPNRQSLLSNKH